MKFCEFCGKQLEDNEKCDCEEAVAQKLPTPKVKPIIKYATIGISAVLVIILICILSVSSKIDPFDYVEVSFSGYNSLGKATVNYSEDDIVYEIIGEEPENYNDIIKWSEKYDMYGEGIDVEYSSTEGLSNGDKFTITFTISGEAKNKVKGGSKTFEVSGLTEVTTVDVFKDIEIVYDGIDGSATADVDRKTESEFLKDCRFVFSEDLGLSAGDKITVTINNIDELAQKHNCVPAKASMEYVVPKLAEYVKSADQIPVETIKNLITQFIKEKSPENDFLFTYGEVKYYNTYFGVGKEDSWTAKANKLEIYICYDEYLRGSYNETVYTPLEFTNILINPDGTVELDFEDGSNATATSNIEKSIEDFKEDYEVQEISVKY